MKKLGKKLTNSQATIEAYAACYPCGCPTCAIGTPSSASSQVRAGNLLY